MNRFLLLLSVVFTSSCLIAQRPQDKMDSLLAAYSRDNKFNGAVLVAHQGNVLYKKAVGYKDVEQKLPVDVNTIFQTGSITKQITAAVIMQLQQEGKLSVADKLSTYFTGFANGDK